MISPRRLGILCDIVLTLLLAVAGVSKFVTDPTPIPIENLGMGAFELALAVFLWTRYGRLARWMCVVVALALMVYVHVDPAAICACFGNLIQMDRRRRFLAASAIGTLASAGLALDGQGHGHIGVVHG